jgi:hypothetical protein
MSFSPQGTIDTAEPVQIRFDRPAVDASMVGKPAAPGSVLITPAVTWKGFWQDRQTLVIEPTAALAPSTRYEVQLAGELGKRTAEFTFAFIHAPLAVEGVWGIAADSLPPDGDVPLSFNQAVKPEDAATHCKLTGDHGDIALAAVDRDSASPFGDAARSGEARPCDGGGRAAGSKPAKPPRGRARKRVA